MKIRRASGRTLTVQQLQFIRPKQLTGNLWEVRLEPPPGALMWCKDHPFTSAIEATVKANELLRIMTVAPHLFSPIAIHRLRTLIEEQAAAGAASLAAPGSEGAR